MQQAQALHAQWATKCNLFLQPTDDFAFSLTSKDVLSKSLFRLNLSKLAKEMKQAAVSVGQAYAADHPSAVALVTKAGAQLKAAEATLTQQIESLAKPDNARMELANGAREVLAQWDSVLSAAPGVEQVQQAGADFESSRSFC